MSSNPSGGGLVRFVRILTMARRERKKRGGVGEAKGGEQVTLSSVLGEIRRSSATSCWKVGVGVQSHMVHLRRGAEYPFKSGKSDDYWILESSASPQSPSEYLADTVVDA